MAVAAVKTAWRSCSGNAALPTRRRSLCSASASSAARRVNSGHTDGSATPHNACLATSRIQGMSPGINRACVRISDIARRQAAIRSDQLNSPLFVASNKVTPSTRRATSQGDR